MHEYRPCTSEIQSSRSLVGLQNSSSLNTSPTWEQRGKRHSNNGQVNASPTSRQCFSILLDNATFSPISVQAGDVSWIFARSAFTLRTRPPVDVEPMLMSNSSFFVSFDTLVCFLSSVFTPSSLRNKNRLISSSEYQPQFVSQDPRNGRYFTHR